MKLTQNKRMSNKISLKLSDKSVDTLLHIILERLCTKKEKEVPFWSNRRINCLVNKMASLLVSNKEIRWDDILSVYLVTYMTEENRLPCSDSIDYGLILQVYENLSVLLGEVFNMQDTTTNEQDTTTTN